MFKVVRERERWLMKVCDCWKKERKTYWAASSSVTGASILFQILAWKMGGVLFIASPVTGERVRILFQWFLFHLSAWKMMGELYTGKDSLGCVFICQGSWSYDSVPIVYISDIYLENGGWAFQAVFSSVRGAGVRFLFQSWVSLSISVLPKGAVPPIDEPRFNQNAEKNGSNDKAVRL